MNMESANMMQTTTTPTTPPKARAPFRHWPAQLTRRPERTTPTPTRWAASAKPGDVCTYHEGDLASDRAGDPALDLAATAWLALADAGQVRLLQRRVGPGVWVYEARRTKIGAATTLDASDGPAGLRSATWAR